MTTKIAVAGATGDLGKRIILALLERGAGVRALVRPSASSNKTAELQARGAEVVQVDMNNVSDLTKACVGTSCVVSVLAGLRDVIVDTQTHLLEAAVAAGVPRFIPSDYSCDFTKTEKGSNRNLDLRREFHERLDKAPIAATSILNGCFMDLLPSTLRMIDYNKKRVSYWGSPDQLLDFTTEDNIAQYTAAAALDQTTPAVLRIAGDQISARQLAALAEELTNEKFELVSNGSIDDLAALIQRFRGGDAEGEKKLYPPWQGMQYMHNMSSGQAKLDPIDNDRYPHVKWTAVRDVLESHLAKNK